MTGLTDALALLAAPPSPPLSDSPLISLHDNGDAPQSSSTTTNSTTASSSSSAARSHHRPALVTSAYAEAQQQQQSAGSPALQRKNTGNSNSSSISGNSSRMQHPLQGTDSPHKSRQQHTNSTHTGATAGATGTASTAAAGALNGSSSSRSSNTRAAAGNRLALRLFELSTLAQACDNWSQRRVLGSGGFGAVYRGVLQLSQTATSTSAVNSSSSEQQIAVAVKRLDEGGMQGRDHFAREVEVLSACRHEVYVLLSFTIVRVLLRSADSGSAALECLLDAAMGVLMLLRTYNSVVNVAQSSNSCSSNAR
jgi:Protein tyrosine and serine/threonine kinase